MEARREEGRDEGRQDRKDNIKREVGWSVKNGGR